MTGELGQLALCLALALSLVQAWAGLAGARAKSERAENVEDGRHAHRSGATAQ